MIKERKGEHKGKIRFWIDQNLHRYEEDETNWHEIGLLPYAVLPTIVAHDGGEELLKRPWIWMESVAASASNLFEGSSAWMGQVVTFSALQLGYSGPFSSNSSQDPLKVYIELLIFAGRWTADMYDFSSNDYIEYVQRLGKIRSSQNSTAGS